MDAEGGPLMVLDTCRTVDTDPKAPSTVNPPGVWELWRGSPVIPYADPME